MPVQLTSRSLSKIAKAVSGDMKHTQKLDAIAKALGYKDQTAIMSVLKREETSQKNQASAREAGFFGKLVQTARRRMDEVRLSALDHLDRNLWRTEVSNGDTSASYEDWVETQKDIRSEEFASSVSGMINALMRAGAGEGDAYNEAEKHLENAVLSIHRGDEKDFAGKYEVLNLDANLALGKIRKILKDAWDRPQDRNEIADAIDGLITNLNPDGKMANPRLGEKITVTVRAVGGETFGEIDARPFFENATVRDLTRLIGHGYDPELCKDVFYLSEDAGIPEAIEARRKIKASRAEYEVVVDEVWVHEWLWENRPEMAGRLEIAGVIGERRDDHRHPEM